MGTGAKVALIMVIVLVILGCTGFCVYWFWWRKRIVEANRHPGSGDLPQAT
jgi:hypothetical protein